MTLLALLLLFLTGTAHAWPPNPFRQGPCPRIQDCREQYLPNPINPPSKDTVQKAIDDANKAAKEEGRLREQVAEFEKAAKNDPATLRSPEYLALLRAHKTAREEKYAAFNAAIDETVRVYHLTPPIRDIRDRAGYPAGFSRAEPWRPRFSEKEIPNARGILVPRTERDLVDEAARNTRTINGFRVNGGVVVARTGNAGNTMLFAAAFADPDRLAMTIFHETSHWIDANAAGGVNPYRTPVAKFLTEAQAYETEGRLARKLGLSNARTSLIAGQYRYQAANSGTKSEAQLKIEHPDWLFPEMAEGLAPLPEPGDADWLEYERLRGERAFAEASRAFETEQRRIAEATARMYQPASPAPPPAGAYMPPPEGLHPGFVAPSAESNADRVRRMVDAACINDWSKADIPSFDRLNGSDLDLLQRVASTIASGCPRSLLQRLIAMRYAGEPLTLDSLRAEVAAISGSASGDIHPDEPRTRGHTGGRGGVTPGDRPSQRGAERRLGSGWKGF